MSQARSVLVLCIIALIAAAPARGHDDDGTTLLLRAGADFQRVGSFTIRSDPTYRGAIRAFGRASSCQLLYGSPAHAIAVWRTLGIRLRLATLGGMPRGETGCTAPDLIRIDRLDVTGTRWRTARGLKIGDRGYRLRQLYANVQYRHPGERFFPDSYWLVSVRKRCVIGVCDTQYVTAPRLVAKMKNGRVSALIFPVGAQGE